MNDSLPFVIAGAGHLGGRAAHALREYGWQGPIQLIGEERHLPYERPPLSKGILLGQRDGASCALRPGDSYETANIEHLVDPVVALDPARCEITLAGGRTVTFDKLLLATGGLARKLAIPGGELALSLRTIDDAMALAPRLMPQARVLVIGGGFIGLEVAAAARTRGCQVTVVEGADRLMGRAVPLAIAQRVLDLHRARGVDIRLQTVPTEIVRTDDRTLGVSLSDGSDMSVSAIVAGIGIVPAADLARQAGLAVNRGIIVSGQLATSEPGIFAAGDVAEFPSPLSGQLIRQESWYNAESQARTAARNMLGGGETYAATPWLWSDQYDHVVQIAGEPDLGANKIIRAAGDAEIHFHVHEDGALAGASGFGPISAMAREFMLARKLVERRYRPRPGELADAGVALKSLLRAG
ncbi:MAG TPA: FAD-dependent oxidoreductase [Dongiaceae bacterium]|nr:FAD-dependent oxidoreductase [Dongiaceae bacterium]